MEHPSLSEPLPAEIAGSGQGWLTAYRRYPVFSPRWAQGRARSIGLVVMGSCVALLLATLLSVPEDRPWGAIAQTVITIAIPLFTGPWLASQVRRRGLPERQEGWALLASMLATVAVVAAFNHWAAEPLKQQVAEWAGQVDEQGRRKAVGLAIGVVVRGGRVDTPDDTAMSPQRPPGRASLETQLSFSVAAFALAGGFALPRWRREREGLRTLARERELAAEQAQRREAQMQLAVLAAQVEPHFLFNTLAGVRGAIRSDPARAAELIDRLVDYLRSAIPRLRSDGAAAATLGEQLDIVRAYLALMVARMPRLAFVVEAEPALLALPCPPLMLISLAENAVKHGAEPKVGPVNIHIRAERREDAQGGRLAVTVADTGAGFGAASSAGGGLGLANIRQRLAQMYGARGTLELRENPGGGVAATLAWPVH
jgi:signal transduction histidine kinase